MDLRSLHAALEACGGAREADATGAWPRLAAELGLRAESAALAGGVLRCDGSTMLCVPLVGQALTINVLSFCGCDVRVACGVRICDGGVACKSACMGEYAHGMGQRQSGAISSVVDTCCRCCGAVAKQP